MSEDTDEDKTRLVAPGQAQGAFEAVARGNALPPGTRLGEFEITGVIGEGGFGIVYAAYDHFLRRKVALKEYMPAALAFRDGQLTVLIKGERYRDAFEAGRRSFVNEAQTLARFDHPSLVKVYRYWEDHGTAYMVMPHYEGITLRQTLEQMPKPVDQRWLRDILASVLDALEIIHRDNTFHRDIAPDNILMLPNGRPVLLDFGAARRVLGDLTHAPTAILKSGYAPIEQYPDLPDMKQGPWTDIYALGAVTYFALIGKPPIPSVGRVVRDALVPLSKVAAGRYGEQFLKAIDKALAVNPKDRPQSVAEFRHLLEIPGPGAPITPRPDSRNRRAWRTVVFVGAGGLLLAAAGAGLYYVANRTEEPRPPPQPTTKRFDSTPKPFDPVEALYRIFEQREPTYAVTVVPDKTSVRIGVDKLSFRLRSTTSGYVYILAVGSDRASFNLLFPNAIDQDNRVDGGAETTLPRSTWRIVSAGPPGIGHFVAIVSETPRDFSAAGLRKGDPYSDFPLDVAERIALSNAPEPSPFAGKPVCPQPGACPTGYGAAVFTIEEVQ